jgi:hypothetical protein
LAALEGRGRFARGNDFLATEILDLNNPFSGGVNNIDEFREKGFRQNVCLLQACDGSQRLLRGKCRR